MYISGFVDEGGIVKETLKERITWQLKYIFLKGEEGEEGRRERRERKGEGEEGG
jgi:hypothetical protein